MFSSLVVVVAWTDDVVVVVAAAMVALVVAWAVVVAAAPSWHLNDDSGRRCLVPRKLTLAAFSCCLLATTLPLLTTLLYNLPSMSMRVCVCVYYCTVFFSLRFLYNLFNKRRRLCFALTINCQTHHEVHYFFVFCKFYCCCFQPGSMNQHKQHT